MLVEFFGARCVFCILLFTSVLLYSCDNKSEFRTQGHGSSSPSIVEDDRSVDAISEIPGTEENILTVEDFGCKISASKEIIEAGQSVVLKFEVVGSREAIEKAFFDDEEVEIKESLKTVSPNESKIYLGRVEGKFGKKKCSVKITVDEEEPTPNPTPTPQPKCEEDPIFCPKEALCPDSNSGMGRRILMITLYTNEGLSNFIREDFKDIETNTGIEGDVFVWNGSNEDILVQKLQLGIYDAIWFLSTYGHFSAVSQIGPLIKREIERGVGLVLLGDNDPYSNDVTNLLTQMLPSWNLKLAGDYLGTGRVGLEGQPSDGQGKLYKHPITAGLYKSVSEGITIAHLSPMNNVKASILDDGDFKKVLLNSAGKLTVGAMEKPLVNPNNAYPGAAMNDQNIPVRRFVIHGGFTSLYRMGVNKKWGWQASYSPGTPQFFYNLACWSANAR